MILMLSYPILTVPCFERSFLVASQFIFCSLLSSLHHGARHNLPDTDAAETARQILTVADGCTAEDLLVVLVSGGGSALLPMPAEGRSLDLFGFVP